MKSKILWIGLAVVLVVVILVTRVISNLDGIVAGIIEHVGSDVLKTDVSVSGVKIDLGEGQAAIGGLEIANPPGFSRANIFEMDGIAVGLNLESLSEDVLVIEAIVIKNPRISLELDADGKSNLDALMANIESGPQEVPAEDTGEGARMIIDHFDFSGATVKVTA